MNRPKCKLCNRNPCQSNGYENRYKTRARKWKAYCSSCYQRKRKGLDGPAQEQKYLLLTLYKKKSHCELCGFVAKIQSQLDVDHIDGNGLNHDHSNLQTICANCHRFKTHEQGDFKTPRVAVDSSVPLPRSKLFIR